MQAPYSVPGPPSGFAVSDMIAAAALALALISSLGSVFTYLQQRKLDKEQRRLDGKHRELEQQVLTAQLADRAESTVALRRSLRAMTDGLEEKVTALQDRRPTPDGMRGAILWTDDEVHRLVDQASRYGDEAADAAGLAATALTNVSGLVRPHLVKNPRLMVAPFDADYLTFELRTASEQLHRLRQALSENGPA